MPSCLQGASEPKGVPGGCHPKATQGVLAVPGGQVVKTVCQVAQDFVRWCQFVYLLSL